MVGSWSCTKFNNMLYFLSFWLLHSKMCCHCGLITSPICGSVPSHALILCNALISCNTFILSRSPIIIHFLSVCFLQILDLSFVVVFVAQLCCKSSYVLCTVVVIYCVSWFPQYSMAFSPTAFIISIAGPQASAYTDPRLVQPESCNRYWIRQWVLPRFVVKF